jgi:hypothetical protein
VVHRKTLHRKDRSSRQTSPANDHHLDCENPNAKSTLLRLNPILIAIGTLQDHHLIQLNTVCSGNSVDVTSKSFMQLLTLSRLTISSPANVRRSDCGSSRTILTHNTSTIGAQQPTAARAVIAAQHLLKPSAATQFAVPLGVMVRPERHTSKVDGCFDQVHTHIVIYRLPING